MHRIAKTALLGIVFAAAIGSVRAMTVEDVIERHVAARGGADNWQAIESMRITGSFTAFSKISPFALQRKRPDRYHMDHKLGNKLVVIGYDGKLAWWDNHWFQEGAQPMGGADLAVLEREVEFATPFVDYAENGHRVELIGETDVDGIPAIGIKVTREDDSEETWYLDPDSYLEIARDSPGSEFGQPMTQRTWYEDFRSVGNVKMPFLVETQWYTRDRVMRVENVELNVSIDDELFLMPMPTGMAPFRDMAGSWKVAVQQRQQPGAPWEDSEHVSTIESLMRGAMIQERYVTQQGTEVIRQLTYDRFRKHYRMTRIDSATTMLDVHQGDFDDEGKLVVSNVDTHTPSEMFGMVLHVRLSISDIGPEGFRTEYDVSTDGGENWFTASKASYTRRVAEDEDEGEGEEEGS